MTKSHILIILVGLFFHSATGAASAAMDEQSKLAQYGQYGGPFSLVDHHGKAVSDRDFLGRYLLIFFGYTYCPDVCPTTMQTVGDALDILGDDGDLIQPAFVSIDPERDTPELLAEFVSHFHPRMLGLTGTKEQTSAVADDYGVTYYKVHIVPSAGGSDDENADYLINHSAATYLMGPDGKFITVFAFGATPSDMATGMRQVLDN